jgi:hypothetical protein
MIGLAGEIIVFIIIFLGVRMVRQAHHERN